MIEQETAEEFKDTVFKDEKGNLLSLYHWTDAFLIYSKKVSLVFHFWTLEAAHDRYLQLKEDNDGISQGTYKEVYLNITNPIELSDGFGVWDASWGAFQLAEKGIITKQQYKKGHIFGRGKRRFKKSQVLRCLIRYVR